MEYLISDKTGTLTENKMILRGVCIGDRVFGGNLVYDEDQKRKFEYNETNQLDDDLIALLKDNKYEKLPYGMDIAPHKLFPTLCMFKDDIEHSQMLDFMGRN